MSTITIIGTCNASEAKNIMANIDAAHAEILCAAMVMRNTETGWQLDYRVTAKLGDKVRGLKADSLLLDEVA